MAVNIDTKHTIVLPSNAPNVTSHTNVNSHFKTTLQAPIHLSSGHWVVGLKELFLPSKILTLQFKLYESYWGFDTTTRKWLNFDKGLWPAKLEKNPRRASQSDTRTARVLTYNGLYLMQGSSEGYGEYEPGYTIKKSQWK